MKKGFINDHIAYLKNNPQGYWFKRKLYGWGWTPATWQGWAITILVSLLIILNVIRFNPETSSDVDVFTKLFPQTALLIIILIVITVLKGEKPRWQWGLKEEENEDNTPFI